jgi:hypothetical protein
MTLKLFSKNYKKKKKKNPLIPGGFASVMLFTKLIDFLHFVRHVLDTLEETNQLGRFLRFFFTTGK